MIVALRRRRDFARLSRHGQFRSAGPLRVRLFRDETEGFARVAFAIPRSVGNAVERNRLRRRLREVLHGLDRSGELAPGDYLVMASPRASSASFSELDVSLRTLVSSQEM